MKNKSEVIMPVAAKPGPKPEPAGLTPQPNGEYAVLINGAVFGRISAAKKAAFILADGKVLEAGVHTVNGRKVTVKDLELSFAPDAPEFKKRNESAKTELLGRVTVE